ncbi:AAA family ATPase [Streptomyces sp. NBC_01335]|uniref:ATP-binding protein n=1 Tax=Streptomyces sp. NBC_01335 TaxID=2903828 RepID=UPI002E0E1AC0|nr:AAA family ATPase [Streptomyces sp. NBC_01335]
MGRERELAAVARALAPDSAEGQALALIGEPGVGKTELLRVVAERARATGSRVLRSRGSEGERGLAYAGLHQLLLPAAASIEQLPEAQRAALNAAFGLTDTASSPDPMVLRLGVLNLLSRLADLGPLLLAVDDVHWMDPASLDILAFLARRLEGEPIRLLVAGRGTALPDRLAPALPTLLVGPLTETDSALLLARRHGDLEPGTRRRILQQARGNPLALIELPGAMGQEGPAAWGRTAHLPLTRRLEEVFAAQLGALPEATAQALLTAAAAGTSDLSVITQALAEDEPDSFEVWRPAEAAGLVHLHAGRLEFRHPLVVSAVYTSAPYAARRRAHLRLASAERDADRRAEHLSAATVTPDEEVARQIETAAERYRMRGAIAEAVAGFVRAAQLSPRPEEQGRRLGIAAVVAMVAGDVTRAEELASRASALSDDPEARAWTAQLGAVAASMTLRMEHAFHLVLPAGRLPDPAIAPYTLTVGAHITHHTARADLRGELARQFAAGAFPPGTDLYATWIAWILDPHHAAVRARAALPTLTAALRGEPAEQHLAGALAMWLDATDVSIGLLDAVAHPDRADSLTVQAGTAAADRAWALFDAGRWSEARLGARSLDETPGRPPSLLSVTVARVLLGTLDAAAGNRTAAETSLRPILDHAETAHLRLLSGRVRWALGLAALTDEDHAAAHAVLRPLYDTDGTPLHPHLGCYLLPELALAAARTGQEDDARAVLARVRESVGSAASPRLAQRLAHAAALLAPADAAEDHFAAALAVPEGPAWPFERALTQLHHGQWLRRRRRVADARVQLAAALDAFERLGARPFADRAEAELRAAGVTVRPPSGDRLAEFSPRTRQVLRLAAEGLTNPQIAERLYLSPRTVASHLYRSFPKLGITHRSQLRDAVPPA